jgi:hypothetical protein
MHHKPLMMHEISKCDGGGACLKHVEWVSRGAVVAGRPRASSWQRLPQLIASIEERDFRHRTRRDRESRG